MGKKKSSKPKPKEQGRFSAETAAAMSPETRNLLNVVLIFGVVALCGGLAVWTWQRVGPLVLQGEDYRLDPARIHITPQPSWVRADVLSEVVRTAGLDANRSFVDPQLAEEVARAFAAHAWVQQVVSVTKQYPGQLDVELTYRRPVAVVKLEGTMSLELHPVDVAGVRLSAAEYSSTELRSFPRISGISKLPDIGRAAEDPAVAAGARLAAILEQDWQSMQFAIIVPPAQNAASTDAVFSLVTRAGSTVIWGPVESSQHGRSADAEKKLAFLRAYLSKNKSLDGSAGPHTLDLRKLPRTTDKMRTAQRS